MQDIHVGLHEVLEGQQERQRAVQTAVEAILGMQNGQVGRLIRALLILSGLMERDSMENLGLGDLDRKETQRAAEEGKPLPAPTTPHDKASARI